MRLYGLLLCGWMTVSLQAQQIHDWENHHVLQINREPARAAFVPFAKQKGDCSMSLDGMWKFVAYQRPENSGSQTALEEIMGDLPLMDAPGYVVDDMLGEND